MHVTYDYILHTIQLNSNENFSLFNIHCDNDAELAILGAYLKIAERLYSLREFLKPSEMCSGASGYTYLFLPFQWWEKYGSDYYNELCHFGSVINEDYFNMASFVNCTPN